MANFNVHFATAIIGGTIAANIGWAAGLWQGSGTLAIIALTTVGGLLPDIDASNSNSVRLLFNLFGLLGMVALSAMLRASFPWWMATLISGMGFLIIRYGIAALFKRFSQHRGNCHSLAMTYMAGVLTAVGSFQLGNHAVLAWAHGWAVVLGVLIHLILDEIYAVDFAGARLKKSFGTALKPISRDNPIIGLALWGIPMALLPYMPPIGSALAALEMWSQGFY